MSVSEESVNNESSVVESYDSYLEYLSWPKKWPELVGSDIFRAQACIKYNTGFYVITMPRTSTRTRPVLLNRYGEEAAHDPFRVVLWLDDHQCVSVTPIVG